MIDLKNLSFEQKLKMISEIDKVYLQGFIDGVRSQLHTLSSSNDKNHHYMNSDSSGGRKT